MWFGWFGGLRVLGCLMFVGWERRCCGFECLEGKVCEEGLFVVED